MCDPITLLQDGSLWAFPCHGSVDDPDLIAEVLPVKLMNEKTPFEITFFKENKINVGSIHFQTEGTPTIETAVFITDNHEVLSLVGVAMYKEKYIGGLHSSKAFAKLKVAGMYINPANYINYAVTCDNKLMRARVEDDEVKCKEVKELKNKTIISYTSSAAAEVFLCTDGLYYRHISDSFYLLASEEMQKFTKLRTLDKKKPKQVIIGNYFIYVLCADGLYSCGAGHKLSLYVPDEEEDEAEEDEEEDDDDQNPAKKKFTKVEFFDGKEILKLVCSQHFVVCWCKEGIYTWKFLRGSDDQIDGFYYGIEDSDSVTERKVVHVEFFNSKTVLDVHTTAEGATWVLCKEGLFLWGEPNLGLASHTTPTEVKFWPKSYPSFFNHHTTTSRLNLKRARPAEFSESEKSDKN